jgi:hypothetical protein
MRSKSESDTVRLNFLVRPEVKDRLLDLREQTGADTLTEVVRRALATYDFLLCSCREGATIYLKEADGEMVRVELPELTSR